MTQEEAQPLANKTLARLQKLAKGNGLEPSDLSLSNVKEDNYTLNARLELSPYFDAETKSVLGQAKGKNITQLGSSAQLRATIDQLRSDFENGGDWIEFAIKEIEEDKTHGWGAQELDISWADQEATYAATENCPECRGAGKHPCTACHSTGRVNCLFCQNTGQEPCPNCMQSGIQPGTMNDPCVMCHGKRFIPCRHCQGRGYTICEHCQGKGSLPCQTCGGKGKLSEVVTVRKKAKARFSFGRTGDLPSGLMRMVSRIGERKIAFGHVDIQMKKPPADAASARERLTIPLLAKIPYAEATLNIKDGQQRIYIFGKRGKLSNVPFFLDASLKDMRTELEKVAQENIPLANVLKMRLAQDALSLVLSGKRHPNHLRRIYPVGLSGKCAQEIMKHLDKAVRGMTKKYRLIAAGLCVLFSIILSGVFFFSPARLYLVQNHGFLHMHLAEALCLLVIMGLSWGTLHQLTRFILKGKFPNLTISGAQNIGRVGNIALGLVFVIYAIFFAFFFQ